MNAQVSVGHSVFLTLARYAELVSTRRDRRFRPRYSGSTTSGSVYDDVFTAQQRSSDGELATELVDEEDVPSIDWYTPVEPFRFSSCALPTVGCAFRFPSIVAADSRDF